MVCLQGSLFSPQVIKVPTQGSQFLCSPWLPTLRHESHHLSTSGHKDTRTLDQRWAHVGGDARPAASLEKDDAEVHSLRQRVPATRAPLSVAATRASAPPQLLPTSTVSPHIVWDHHLHKPLAPKSSCQGLFQGPMEATPFLRAMTRPQMCTAVPCPTAPEQAPSGAAVTRPHRTKDHRAPQASEKTTSQPPPLPTEPTGTQNILETPESSSPQQA